ncbi:Ras GTPase-activating-like protein rng2 [Psilocybe cubensis]|uniref:Ras GTPase-activating-like protein rng2 n=2 Tax=Psilocybe cubensis TaxID=181762 RepID=A0ACB8H3Q2_PSICU|nr:Ras GTPase-activating-like protein rng2 [Psilocybe cubensis]KAH9482628.1 Ras GTPase-activating-like protein rng2 [Psilocybe cubensis]
MDRSNSLSSSSSNAHNGSRPASSGPFAYQTRLLERTSSRGGSSSLSRSSSQSSISILTNSTGSSVGSVVPRRWTPSHRVGNSLDAVRGKWEERSRESYIEDVLNASSTPTKEPLRSRSHSVANNTNASATFDNHNFLDPDRPLTPTSITSTPTRDNHTTPKYLKRQTLPAPIITTPLSPNSTGVSVEVDSSLSSTPQRIHIPHVASTNAIPSFHVNTKDDLSNTFVGQHISSSGSTQTRVHRAHTLDSSTPQWMGTITPRSDRANAKSPQQSESPNLTEYLFVKNSGPGTTAESPVKRSFPRPLSRNGTVTSNSRDLPSPNTSSSSTPGSSPMHPTPYRSSYMANKKADSYSEILSVTGKRRLGNHLPRIASGDADDSWVDDSQPQRTESSPTQRTRALQSRDISTDRHQAKVSPSGVVHNDGIAGLPGRIPLKAPNPNMIAPTPSSRLLGGSWADKQRHLLHAYEYLCHVGEAQQWIEGCLGEELEFGVVEMEEGLRNGVVLAKLVRTFMGDAAVRKIYEAPKLDFRHSDNINHFFKFVRDVGLPEGFIFELTDLYEKKNLPKVIYCIHALSHLLARRGMAQRIGNLLGHLHFSDDQLQQTQKGLKEAGVPMPNFGNVGRELAKEINEEPEVEIETDDERRDRLLLENESSIIMLQSRARGYLARKALVVFKGRIRLAERHVIKLQTQAKAVLVRRQLLAQRKSHDLLFSWAIALQARARAALVRQRWRARLRSLKRATNSIIGLQAQIRGVLQRRRYQRFKAALRKINFPTKFLQAAARGVLQRRTQKELTKSFIIPEIGTSIVGFQSHARAVLLRRRVAQRIRSLQYSSNSIISLQAHCRGLIMRRKMRSQIAKLENVTHVVISIQAAVRTYLARKRLLMLIRGLRKATSVIVGLQARARANLTRQRHVSLQKALVDVNTIKSVGRLQAFAKAAIIRNQHRELDKKLDVAMPDVLGIQAAARGAILRREYQAWKDHIQRNHPVATMLQALLRGAMQRRAFRQKIDYYRANLNKVVKIQSLFRAKETREQYRQLTLGKNVTVGTIKNFVHLLDDSEADFQEEIKVERLRKRVVEHIRENQALENDVHDLDVKIALVVQNLKSFEDVIKARRRHGGDSAALAAARVSLLAAHGDPFSGPNTLDQDARRKLELYQQLFYLLQIRGDYLTRLLVRLSMDGNPESSRRFTERVVLTLFGYGQDRREDFLLLKLFQTAIRDEIYNAPSIDDIIAGHPMYINIAVHYVRPRQVTYVRDSFQAIIRELIDADDLDLEADPSLIHRARLDVEEMRSGKPSPLPKNIPFREAVVDPDTRAIYIRHLQVLQWWTEAFVNAIVQSTKKMPYCMRFLARETILNLKEKFPGLPEEVYGACVARLVFYRYINPALITPEMFDIVPKTINITTAKKNLAQISQVLAQIASGVDFGDDKPSYVPINDFVRKAILQFSAWFNEVADVPDAETHFHAHEFMDATVQPKPIYISPNEIYTIHSLLLQHQDFLKSDHDDALKVILSELGGVPHLDNEELKEARDTAITLELTNRFAYVQDPLAEEKTLWVQAKRGVLAILRVQPAQDLLESLMQRVTENDEALWEEILEAEIENEIRQMPRRQPSTAVNDSAYRLEDIRSLKFAAVKALAISNLLELEKLGKITRDDGFQGILNAIAGDVRSKHRKRLQRQQEMESMNEALRQLAERKKYFEEQIDSYHNYVETAMNTMQKGKGKRRPVLPFSKQYFHLRDLQRTGQAPQFGSFLYSAKKLYDRGILLSIDQYSPRQFDKLQITMSSNRAGVFNLSLESTMLGVTSRIAAEDIRMEDLLQAKYEKKSSLPLFGGKVKVNFELFLFQINKKFYA